MTRTLVCAHRGSSAYLPENSADAFVSAIAMGADAIETDVRRTPQGRLVLAHDPLPAQPSPDLVELGDLVALAAGRIRLDVELKEAGYEQEVLEVLTPQPEGLLVTSFLPEVVTAIRALDPTVRTGLILGPWDESPDRFARADDCGAEVLVPHVDLLDDGLRDEAVRRRQPLVVWTVNDRDALARLIADPAVGCVITDVPDVALVLRGGGQPLA
ncbi:MAG TPA: glycerophosphodiester phosphodiesterase [Gaiellales bacterium]|nr:glycerophosphodiester phosphodiesterase [Gaiellales bacterium]